MIFLKGREVSLPCSFLSTNFLKTGKPQNLRPLPSTLLSTNAPTSDHSSQLYCQQMLRPQTTRPLNAIVKKCSDLRPLPSTLLSTSAPTSDHPAPSTLSSTSAPTSDHPPPQRYCQQMLQPQTTPLNSIVNKCSDLRPLLSTLLSTNAPTSDHPPPQRYCQEVLRPQTTPLNAIVNKCSDLRPPRPLNSIVNKCSDLRPPAPSTLLSTNAPISDHSPQRYCQQVLQPQTTPPPLLSTSAPTGAKSVAFRPFRKL